MVSLIHYTTVRCNLIVVRFRHWGGYVIIKKSTLGVDSWELPPISRLLNVLHTAKNQDRHKKQTKDFQPHGPKPIFCPFLTYRIDYELERERCRIAVPLKKANNLDSFVPSV